VPLGTKVGVVPGNIVLDGAQLPQKGTQPAILGPCLLWPNGHPSQLLLSTCIYCNKSDCQWLSVHLCNVTRNYRHATVAPNVFITVQRMCSLTDCCRRRLWQWQTVPHCRPRNATFGCPVVCTDWCERPQAPSIGMQTQNSCRYAAATPWRHFHARTLVFKIIWWQMSSQWSLYRLGIMVMDWAPDKWALVF